MLQVQCVVSSISGEVYTVVLIICCAEKQEHTCKRVFKSGSKGHYNCQMVTS